MNVKRGEGHSIYEAPRLLKINKLRNLFIMISSKKDIGNLASHIDSVEELANVLNLILSAYVNVTTDDISVSELNMYSDVRNN